MRSIALLVTSVLIVSQVAFANIRVIGNGGGEDEMQALSLFAAAQEIVALAVNSQSIGTMLPADRELLAKAHAMLTRSPSEKWRLTFQSSGPNVVYDSAQREIKLNLDAVLNSESRLDLAILKYYLKASGVLNDFETKSMALALLPTEDWELETVAVKMGSVVVFHSGDVWTMAYRDRAGFVDFARMMGQEFPTCSRGGFEFRAIESVTRESDGFLAKIKFQCGEEERSARLRAQISQDGQWNLFLFGVSSGCAPSLIE